MESETFFPKQIGAVYKSSECPTPAETWKPVYELRGGTLLLVVSPLFGNPSKSAPP